jgi:hypothetical protein
MSRNKITISVQGPVLSGSISTAESTCGKPNCACKDDPPKLHGIYYRWTGAIDGKRTTRTISKEMARECERRIENYRALQKKIDDLIEQALLKAPWNEE